MTGVPLTEAGRWIYAQLFLPQTLASKDLTSAADRILLGDLQPLFAEFSAQGHTWFFIRYLEHGYHLRLRVHAKAEACLAPLRNGLCTALAGAVARGADLRFSVYEPEIAKYCGPIGNDVAERHFCASSAIAIRAVNDGSALPSGHALRLLAQTLDAAGFDCSQRLSWCRAYYDYWWRAFGGHDGCMQEDEALYRRSRATIARWLTPDPENASAVAVDDRAWIRSWAAELFSSRRTLENLERMGRLVDPMRHRDEAQRRFPFPLTQLSMLPNFWHMLCNRLGVSIRLEMRLAFCLMRHLALQSGIEPQPMTINLIPESP